MPRFEFTPSGQLVLEPPFVTKTSKPGEWGYTHIDNDDLWEIIELLQFYAATISPIGDHDDNTPTGRFNLLAATTRLISALSEAAADENEAPRGTQCRAYLADVAEEEERARAATHAREQKARAMSEATEQGRARQETGATAR